MPEIPILGRGQRGGPAAVPLTGQRKYAAQLTTAANTRHVVTFDFGVPVDEAGVPQLGALQGFDPERETVANLVNMISAAHIDPVVAIAQGVRQGVTLTDVNGVHVVWRHVVSFFYLGPADDLPAEG